MTCTEQREGPSLVATTPWQEPEPMPRPRPVSTTRSRTMPDLRVPASALRALLVFGLLGPTIGEAKQRSAPPACAAGRYVVASDGSPLLPGHGPSAPEVLVVETGGRGLRVTMSESCAPAPVRAGRKRGRTTLQARWKRCGSARKVALSLAFDGECAVVTGAIKSKGTRPRRFEARRSTCGDRVLDRGAGEACDSSGAECGADAFCRACACLPGVFSDENAWGVEGSPLPPGATLVPLEEYLRLARLAGAEPLRKGDLDRLVAEEAARIAADRALVDAEIARHPELAKLVTVNPPPDAVRVGTDDVLVTVAGGEQVVLHGADTAYSQVAESLRGSMQRENIERIYADMWGFVPADRRGSLPEPTALAGLTDEEVYEYAVEAALLHQELVPNVGPDVAAEGDPEPPPLQRLGNSVSLSSACVPQKLPKESFPLKGYVPPARNQWRRGTCGSFATTAALETYVWKHLGLAFRDLSEQELYAQARGRWFPTPNAFGDGLAVSKTLARMRETAFRHHLESAWAYNPSRSRTEDRDRRTYRDSCVDYGQTCSDTNHQGTTVCTSVLGIVYCLATLTHVELLGEQNSEHYVVTKHSGIFYDPRFPEPSWVLLKSYLNAGKPVILAHQIDDGFDNATADDPWIRYDARDAIRGAHFVIAVGYDEDLWEGQRSGWLIIRNSWGCNWGDGGYGYLRYHEFRDLNWLRHRVTGAVAVLGVQSGGRPAPPAVSLSSDRSLVRSGEAVRLSAAVAAAVETVEFYQGFTRLATDTGAPFTHVITYSNTPDKTNYYWARAYDAAGNFADSSVIAIQVKGDASPPTVALVPWSTNATAPAVVQLIATAQDDRGIAKVEFFRSRGFALPTKVGEDTGAPYVQAVSLDAPGTYRYFARATDTSGNATNSEKVAIAVAAPSSTTTSAPSTTTSSSTTSTTTSTKPTSTTTSTSTTSTTTSTRPTSTTTSTKPTSTTTSTSTTSTTTLPRLPDLRPTRLDVLPTVVETGATVEVTWSVRNDGAATASPTWQDGLWLNTVPTPGGTFFGDTPRSTTLAPDAAYTASRRVTLPPLPAGTYYFIVRTDRTDAVYEGTRENNNDLVSVPLTVRTPDLRPTRLDVLPTVVETGATVEVTWSVRNDGAATASPTWQDGLWLNTVPTPGGTFFGDTPRSTTLAPDAAYTASRRVTLPPLPAGTYYFIVRTDRTDAVYEGTRENNNDLVSVPLTVRTPDLRPTQVSVIKPAPGVIQVVWTVTNAGTASARASWQDGIWINRTPTPGGTFIGDTPRTSDLAPGASYTANRRIDASGLAAGTYYVVVRTDRTDTVYEAVAENDNDLASTAFTLP